MFKNSADFVVELFQRKSNIFVWCTIHNELLQQLCSER